MTRLRLWPLAALLLPLSAAADPPAADGNGDPLPKFARARLGSTRFQHGSPIRSARYLPGAKAVASYGRDSVLRVWDRADGRERRHFDLPESFLTSADGATTLVIPDGKEAPHILDLTTGATRRLEGIPAARPHNPTALSSDGKVLAVAVPGEDQEEPGRVRFWDTATGKERPALSLARDGKKKEERFRPTALYFSPDGKLLAAVGNAEGKAATIRLWDLAAGKERPTPAGQKGIRPPVLFTPDGKMLLSQDLMHEEATPWQAGVWDAATGKKLHALGNFECGADALVLAPDGKTLAVVPSPLQGGAPWLWDLATGKQLPAPPVGVADLLIGVAFAPDGKTLAVASVDDDLTLVLWDVAAGKVVRPMKVAPGDTFRELPDMQGGGLGFPLAFTPDGKELLLAYGATLLRWDPVTGNERRPHPAAPRDAVNALAVAPDGKRLVAAYNDQTARLWDVAAGKELAHLKPPARVRNPIAYAAAFAPDGKTTAVGWTEGAVQLWDVAAGKERRTLDHPGGGGVVSLAFAPDGKALVSADAVGSVMLWDPERGLPRGLLVDPPPPPDQGRPAPQATGSARVAFSPDGRTVAALTPDGEDYQVRLWELATGKLRQAIPLKARAAGDKEPYLDGRPDPTALAFSPDGRALLWVARRKVQLWDLGADKEQRALDLAGEWLEQAAFSPDGRWVAGAGVKGSVRLWDAATGALRGRRAGHRGPATALAFTADGRTLVTGGGDTSVLIWDAGGRDEPRP